MKATKISKCMPVITVLVILFAVFNLVCMTLDVDMFVREIVNGTKKWYVWKILVLSGLALFGLMINVLAIMFMLYSTKSARCGKFFTKRNATTIWFAAPVCFLYNLCVASTPILNDMSRIELRSGTFLLPLLLIGFAIIYSAGVRLSE